MQSLYPAHKAYAHSQPNRTTKMVQISMRVITDFLFSHSKQN